MIPRVGNALVLALSALLLSCGGPLDVGGSPEGDGGDDDPLSVPDMAEPGTLDALHRTIILPSCAGQAGLCHYGQFEPNLSTPALTYENLVRRPSLEHGKQLRVAPGDPDSSLLIDKLRNRNVISQMPLGATPLPDDQIAEIEAWIQAGALRRPGAEPAPVLNNPPAVPEIAIFDGAGNRLDSAGQTVVHPGQPLTFRMSVEDYETADPDVYIALFELFTSSNELVLLVPQNGTDGTLAIATYEDAAPEGKGDKLDYRFDYTFPDTVFLVDQAQQMTEVPSAGLTLNIIAAYADQLPQNEGMLVFTLGVESLKVAP